MTETETPEVETPTDKTFQSVSDEMLRLIKAEKGNGLVRGAYLQMVQTRRLYNMAWNVLRRNLRNKGVVKRGVDIELIEKGLLGAVKMQSEEVFDPTKLVFSIPESLFKFFAEELSFLKHMAIHREHLEELEKFKQRTAIPIPLSGDHIMNIPQAVLPRGESILLVGPEELVRKAIRGISPVPDNPLQMVIFALSLSTPADESLLPSNYAIQLLIQRWQGCTRAADGVSKAIDSVTRSEIAVDLLVIEDLMASRRDGSDLIFSLSEIHTAHKRFKQWAKDNKAAMLSAVRDTDTANITERQWHTLAEHCDIFRVLASDDDKGFALMPMFPIQYVLPATAILQEATEEIA